MSWDSWVAASLPSRLKARGVSTPLWVAELSLHVLVLMQSLLEQGIYI